MLGQLGRWMTDNESCCVIAKIGTWPIIRFLTYRSADSFRQTPHRPGLRLLLELLVEEQVVEAEDPGHSSELDAMLV